MAEKYDCLSAPKELEEIARTAAVQAAAWETLRSDEAGPPHVVGDAGSGELAAAYRRAASLESLPMEQPGQLGRLAATLEDLRPLHDLCRAGHLYEVEQWIADGKPLQIEPDVLPKGTKPKTALQIALETGQHSLASLLLKSGYRLDLERYRPLDKALAARRWDLVDLLVASGLDLKSADQYTVLETYNVELYDRLWMAGYDLTADHVMASVLGYGTSNRPLLGFVKRHRTEDPRLQQELNIALGCHVRRRNERGIALCLWAGADPHAPAPSLEIHRSDDPDPDDADRFIGFSAIEEAAIAGDVEVLKRLGADPARDDWDDLYRHARYSSTVAYLAKVRPPKDLTSIISSQVLWVGNRFPGLAGRGTSTVEEILSTGVRWEETDPEELARIRRSLLELNDYDLRRIVTRLKRPETCAPQTFAELTRTAKIQARLLALGLVRKPVSEQERRADEAERLLRRYDRAALYEQVWSKAVQEVAKSYGISGVRLGKVCRALKVPVPPRGYWARVRSGYTARRPTLPKLDIKKG